MDNATDRQTAQCRQFNAYIDSILASVAIIRSNSGPGTDGAIDELTGIIEDAEKALAVNDQIQRGQ